MKFTLQLKKAAFFAVLVFLIYQLIISAFPRPKEQVFTPLSIETGRGSAVFQVEVADTPETLMNGLMDRKSMDSSRGMLFLFPQERIAQMWMKNTYIPLDMLFIDKEGRIARIAHKTTPLSLDVIDSGKPVIAVLEVNGGVSQTLNIKEGDRVKHERLP